MEGFEAVWSVLRPYLRAHCRPFGRTSMKNLLIVFSLLSLLACVSSEEVEQQQREETTGASDRAEATTYFVYDDPWFPLIQWTAEADPEGQPTPSDAPDVHPTPDETQDESTEMLELRERLRELLVRKSELVRRVADLEKIIRRREETGRVAGLDVLDELQLQWLNLCILEIEILNLRLGG